MTFGSVEQAQRLQSVGAFVLRYSLVFFFVAFGLYKFTPQEAAGIEPLMAHSIGLFWVYDIFDKQMGSDFIGVIEIAFGILVAIRPISALLSAIGSLGMAFALVNTLSFLFTTPGLDSQSSDAGFLLKDLTLLGAALWTAGEAFLAASAKGAPAMARA
jgi:uncharacterized membrane protein YkgB